MQINEILQKKLAIDLIVSDVMMPKLDGFMMVERVRAHAEMQKVPVIFITALKTREHIVRAQELKANGYLIKPIISDHFYAKLLQIFPDLNNKVSSLQLRVGKL
jgi:DNA-binding response OmpR family regulator